MVILKFHPRMKCLHVFFSFFSSRDEISSLSFTRDEISSRQKRVNSQRHFTIDRDDFIPGRVSSQDEISRVNTLLQKQPSRGFLKKSCSENMQQLLCNFIEITFQYGCSPVNLLPIWWLLLRLRCSLKNSKIAHINIMLPIQVYGRGVDVL